MLKALRGEVEFYAVDAARCVRCDAVLLEGAPWCSLCFEPVAKAASVTSASAPLAPPMTPARAAAIIAALPPGVEEIAEPTLVAAGMFGADAMGQDGVVSGPGLVPSDRPAIRAHDGAGQTQEEAAEEADTRTWPCLQCGADVPLAEMACTDCGAGFMGGGGPVALDVKTPLLAKLVTMPRGQAILVAGLFGFTVAAACVGLLWLVADLF